MLPPAASLAAFAALVTCVAAPIPTPNPPPGKAKALLDQMRAGTYRQGTDWFPKLGWADVPDLLDRAGSEEPLKAFPTNPISSLAHPHCSEGVMAMWLAEGVRKGGKYPSLNPILVPADPGAKLPDQPDVVAARAYRAWWWMVKTMPQEKAREVNPLDGTGLRWR